MVNIMAAFLPARRYLGCRRGRTPGRHARRRRWYRTGYRAPRQERHGRRAVSDTEVNTPTGGRPAVRASQQAVSFRRRCPTHKRSPPRTPGTSPPQSPLRTAPSWYSNSGRHAAVQQHNGTTGTSQSYLQVYVWILYELYCTGAAKRERISLMDQQHQTAQRVISTASNSLPVLWWGCEDDKQNSRGANDGSCASPRTPLTAPPAR